MEISIHALRVEGDSNVVSFLIENKISIHALRVEGDRRRRAFARLGLHFYPRPPGGGRRFQQCLYFRLGGFLSTPSGWRATLSPIRPFTMRPYFYPRPPGGGRRIPYFPLQTSLDISIHALRVEGDYRHRTVLSNFVYFYPRPPGGGRLPRLTPKQRQRAFLSTPSGWRATAKTDKVFVCFCAKGRRICLFKTRKEKNLPVAF